MMRGGIPFSNAPGIAYEYSNFGFAILGRIVANVVDRRSRVRRLHEYVTENILKPLGMTSTTLEPSSVPADRLAHGYRWEDEQWKNEPLLAERLVRLDGRHADVAVAIWAATSARSSPRGRRATARRPAPIRRSSLREMQQVWRPGAGVGRRATPTGAVQLNAGGYGFGLRVSQTCAVPDDRRAQRRAARASASLMRWLPDYGVGIDRVRQPHLHGLGRDVRRGARRAGEDRRPAAAAIEPSPALTAARDAVSRLVVKWDDAVADRIAAENLFLDQSRRIGGAPRSRRCTRRSARARAGVGLRSRRERAARRLDDELRARQAARWRSRWRRRCRRRCSSCP